jgi:hypothetical protein
MATQQIAKSRQNALKGDGITVRLEQPCRAPAETVYDLLADISSHLEWGGTKQPSKSFRLLTIDAPDRPATVGTEFRSTGADGMGQFTDTSVVTEASRPGVFEFVTEAQLATKKGAVVEWTIIHRYDVTPRDEGCLIAYTYRMARISSLPGPLVLFKVPGLRALLLKVSSSYAGRGLRNLGVMAEARAQTNATTH